MLVQEEPALRELEPVEACHESQEQAALTQGLLSPVGIHLGGIKESPG